MENETLFRNMKFRDAFIFIAIGLLMILLSIIFHSVHLFEINAKVILLLNDLFVQILSHIGIGCLAIGIITIVIDMGHWTNYFEERLSKIVTEKQYLEKLDTTALINLQTEVLKAYFKNDQIGGADGFLTYYQKNIQGIIGMPFRTNVKMNLNIQPSGEKKLKVIETLSYTCMENAGKIQDQVCYLPEKGEHSETLDFKVILQHESFKSTKGDITGSVHFNLSKLLDSSTSGELQDGFELDIKEYCQNTLNVFVTAEYLVNVDRFIAWRMSHPSRNVSISLYYPKNLALVKEFFFNENDSFTEHLNEANGTYFLSIHDWLLPDEGMTFQFVDREETPVT